MQEQFATDGYALVRKVSLVRNGRKTAIQSVGMRDGLLSVFYHDSLVQTYKDGKLVEEYAPAEGDLFHANDCDAAGRNYWICDTGTNSIPPMIKLFDPDSRKVLGSWNVEQEGWRTAAVTEDGKGKLIVVSVQAIDSHIRTEMLVSSFDPKTGKAEMIGKVPMHHRFVQGCSREGDALWISSNDGRDSATTRFVCVSLPSCAVLKDLHFKGFGEAEGMFRLDDGSFLVGRNHEDGYVYLLEKKNG